jgi:hypothetical protein
MSAAVDTVRLCFLVKVRKASGRKVPGGRTMGRTVGGLKLGAGGGGRGLSERGSGVPKAGEEEGRTLSEEMGSLIAARRGFLMAVGFAGRSGSKAAIVAWGM